MHHRARVTRERTPGGLATAIALLAYSLLTNRREASQGWYVVRNVGAAVLLIAVARRRGLAWSDLGLGLPPAPDGVRVGAQAATASIAAVAAGTAVATGSGVGRQVLADRRATIGRTELLWQALVRIPIGTAAFEEIAFRGVLYALIADRHGRRAGLLASSATFGLWHIGPTLAALRINDVTTGRARACVGAVALTALAGQVLGGLRIAGGHVVSPWLAHWAINAVALAAASGWQRSGRSGGTRRRNLSTERVDAARRARDH